MNTHVLCFAQPTPESTTKNLVLIHRKKMDWQAGRLNLPGGRIESYEMPELAALRELREEAGIHALLSGIRIVGRLVTAGGHIPVAICPYNARDNAPRTMSDEGDIVVMPAQQAIDDSRLLPNLRIIIPFCLAGVTGWTLTDSPTSREHIVAV